MKNDHRADSGRFETHRAGFPWSPHSLWTLLALTGIAAVVLLAAFRLGYVDAGVIVLAIVLLVCVTQRPYRAHPATAVVLTAVTAILLWANLKAKEEGAMFHLGGPPELNPVTRALFWRGWPLSPFMVCPYRHMTYLPAEGFVEGALICDGSVFVAALLATRFLLERGFRSLRMGPVPGTERAQRIRPRFVGVPTRGFLAGVLFGLLELTASCAAPWYLDLNTGRAVRAILNTLNAPAVWLDNRWVHALSRFANREFAQHVAPFLTVLILWGTIGLIGGILWGRKVEER
jgi:hypothetical protein